MTTKLSTKQLEIIRKLEDINDSAFIEYRADGYYLVSADEEARLNTRTVQALARKRAIWRGIDGRYVARPAEYREVRTGNILAWSQDWEGAEWIVEDRSAGVVGAIKILNTTSGRYADLSRKGNYRRIYRTTVLVTVFASNTTKIEREVLTDKRGKFAVKDTLAYWGEVLNQARWIARNRAERNGASTLEIERANSKAFDGSENAQYRALSALANLLEQ